MKALLLSRLSAAVRFAPIPLIASLLLLPAVVSAQDVPVVANGFVSLTGPAHYNGKYVLYETDFGFFWLDTSALTAGHVQAEAKCLVAQGFPPSDSNFYVIEDCNGIGGVRTSGTLVEAFAGGGQCYAVTHGCGGSSDSITRTFFSLGSWTYLGDQNYSGDISDSTQTADPEGRTWSMLLGTPNDLKHYVWHASGNPNAPPTANATAMNNSAAGRADKTNYFGDQWTFTDASNAVAAIDEVEWSFLNTASPTCTVGNGSSGPWDETDSVNSSTPTDTHSFPFPCLHSSFSTPANCWASVESPTATTSYKFALQANNVNGWSCPFFVSNAITVHAPQIGINGSLFTNGGTLNILTGKTNNGDASATQGNTASATFNWVFNFGGPLSGKVITVPTNASTFTLTVTWADGYSAQVSGSINQTDLVPSFTLSPNPVLLNASLTLTNTMQIGSATLASVDYDWESGACDGRTSITKKGTLPSTFNSVNATAPVGAPPTAGSYCMYLQYNFTGSKGSQSLVTADPFTATSWAPSPVPVVEIHNTTNLACTGIGTCGLKTSTTYDLWDGETGVPNGSYPGASWSYITGSGSSTIGSSSGQTQGPVSWTTPSTACNSGCSLQVTAGTATASIPITVTSGGGGGGGGGSLTVSISGPTSVNVGQNASYTANVSGASGSISYSWNFGDSQFPIAGTATMTHAWSTGGVYSITVTATSGSATGTGSTIVSVAGNPTPSGAFTLSPSQQTGSTTYAVGVGQTVTFTSAETNASMWGWVFGDGSLAGGPNARVVPKAYAAEGTYSASLQVYGDNIHTTGITTANFTVVVGAPLPSPAFTVSGATLDSNTGNYDAEVGNAMTLTASEPNASSWSWTFGDGTTASGKSVTKSYTGAGSFTVTLTVTGDGVNNGGTTTGKATMVISPSTFKAAIVPGVAHLNDGVTSWTTDFSTTNPGSAAMTINLAFVPLLAPSIAPTSLNLSQIAYGDPIVLQPGGSYSVPDVVSALNGGNNKGTLVIKYSGAGVAPLVSTRVSFAPAVNPNNISYGSGLPTYQVDSSGRISAQGFVSVDLEAEQGESISPAAIEAAQSAFTVTVSQPFAGTGSGTVTSNPAGISCPPTCSATFSGSAFLSGVAAAGSTFAGITGCDSYPVGSCAMVSTKTVTARFNLSAPPPPPGNQTLTVSKAGSGTGTVTSSPAGISCGATCSASFTQGTAVTLTAAPDSGQTFAGWSGGGCAGTGSCVVTLSADAAVTATFNGPSSSGGQAAEILIGLRSDTQYRFGVALFNAAGASGTFRLTAADEDSSPVLMSDGAGNLVAYRDFTIAPYQQVYLQNADLGLSDANKRYVLTGTRTSSTGTLLAFGTALDRQTNDFLQVTDDSQVSQADSTGTISYWVAGVSHYDTTYGAHWRTDLRIYNRGTHGRNLYFEYDFTADGVTEHVAHVSEVSIASGQLLTYDDVIATLMAQDTSVNLSGSSAGILRVYYPEDSDSASRPLIIGSRNYDDQTTGTAGTQLAVYTLSQAASPGQQLVFAGVEESAQYSSRIGVFAIDPGPVTGTIVAVAPDGTQVGSLPFSVGGGTTPHYGQIALTQLNGFNNPNQPVSIRIEQIGGGRLGAYGVTVDKVTLDTNFIQALPQQTQ